MALGRIARCLGRLGHTPLNTGLSQRNVGETWAKGYTNSYSQTHKCCHTSKQRLHIQKLGLAAALKNERVTGFYPHTPMISSVPFALCFQCLSRRIALTLCGLVKDLYTPLSRGMAHSSCERSKRFIHLVSAAASVVQYRRVLYAPEVFRLTSMPSCSTTTTGTTCNDLIQS